MPSKREWKTCGGAGCLKRIATALTLGLVAVCLSAPALAWNSFGHMTVAAVAYSKLTPSTKDKVASLLRRNPDYANWIEGVPAADRDRVAFAMAATWPDVIKHASGYVNDGNEARGPDAARNIGYADKLQHRYWHYIDLPFSADGTPARQALPPNAKTQIAAFRAVLKSPSASDNVKSYDLVWLLHLVGDVHQPLHATSRFDKDQPDGDRGGNLVTLCAPPCRDELHAFWDDLLGKGTDPEAAIRKASDLPAAQTDLAAIGDEATWIGETFDEARKSVYVAPIGVGAGPFNLDPAYKIAATRVAEDRVALAGARLANVLNAGLVLAAKVEHVEPPTTTTASTTDKIVVFNTKTLKYHDPSCILATRCTRHCITIPLSEARRRGGVPCKACGG
jgi:hypothetical protein